MAGPLDTKQTVTIAADNRPFLKAQAAANRAREQAAAKQDAELAKALAAQGKLTQEAFNTAKAQALIGIEIQKQASIASKGLDLVKGKVTEFGKGLVGGVVAGLGGALLGGGIGSIVQELFAPPSPEQIAAWARAGDEAEFFGVKVGKMAQNLLEQQRQIELSTEATKGFIAEVESITHGRELELLREQLRIAEEQAGKGWDAAAEAAARFRRQIAELTDPTIKAGIEDLYKTLFGTAAENFIKVVKENDRLIERQKKWAEENKSLEKSLDSLRASLDPIVAQQQKYEATQELLEKSRRRGLISAAEERALNWQVAQSLYEVRKAALAAAEAKARVPVGGTPEGGAIPGSQGGGINATRSALADQAMAEHQARQERQNAEYAAEQRRGADQFQGMDVAQRGFENLTSAAGSLFEAIITGSESAGKAFTKALGGMLKGDAVWSGVQALKAGAYALWLYATGDPAKGSIAAASAAKFAITAAAAGAGAALLGAGGGGGGGSGGGGAGAGSGGYYGSGSGGDPNRGTERVIVVGDSNGSSSPRFEAVKARRYASLAGASSDRVRYE